MKALWIGLAVWAVPALGMAVLLWPHRRGDVWRYAKFVIGWPFVALMVIVETTEQVRRDRKNRR